MHKGKTNLTRRAVSIAALAFGLFAGAAINAQPFNEPAESQLQTHGHYTNHFGETVHSPSKTKIGNAPEGATATAQCRDGSYSFSHNHSGTCSGHHGVVQWFRP
jgi:hypothetical protein